MKLLAYRSLPILGVAAAFVVSSGVNISVAASQPPVKQGAKAAKTAVPAMSAAMVLDKYVEVTGGKAAYNKIKSTTTKGVVRLTAQNLTGKFYIFAKAPNKMHSLQEFANIGKSEQGYDGKVAWGRDPFNGLRTLEGQELAQIKTFATFNIFARWREVYRKVEMIGIRKVGARSTYAIRLTPATGKPTVQYHDTKTFLVLRSDTVQDSPQGSIPVESYFEDYRVVDGIRTPFKVRSRLAAAELLTTITEVKNNVPIDDARFSKPDAADAAKAPQGK
jgi:hypothetical protein